MAFWTKSTKRQRGSVKAHEAKANGKRARRQEDRREVEADWLEPVNYDRMGPDGLIIEAGHDPRA